MAVIHLQKLLRGRSIQYKVRKHLQLDKNHKHVKVLIDFFFFYSLD